MLVDPPGAVSDQSLIHWRVPLQTQPPIVVQREMRRWKSIDTDAFRTVLPTSDLCDVGNLPSTSDEYFDCYDRVLRALADEFAPVLRLGRRRQRLVQWMDAECFRLHHQSRRLEKRYRRSQTEDRLEWVLHERKRHETYRQNGFSY